MTTTQGESKNSTATTNNVQTNANGFSMSSVGGNSCELNDSSNIVVGMRSTTSVPTNSTTTVLSTTNTTSTIVNKNPNNTTKSNLRNNNNNNMSGANIRNQSNSFANNNNANHAINGAEVIKRKKLKSRSNSLLNNSSSVYAKNHLDAWLETCLKDASSAQLSSSSEFLDYNPTPTNSGKKHMQQQPQQQITLSTMQQQQQQNHQIFLQQQINQTQQQSQSSMRTNNQSSMAYPAGNGTNGPFSQSFQRQFMKHNLNNYNQRYSNMFPNAGGVGMNGGSYYGQTDVQDFASLPPLVNLLEGNTDVERNSTEVLDGNSENPNATRGFRFSDPCLLNPSDNDSKISGQNTPDRRLPSDLENNKFFAALMEQINILHETNSKICRNLHETKVDIEALKHAPSWGLRHRRDSLSGLSTHSQPMVFGGGFGTQSPAPTFHSGAYTPGIMTDVVREVKEAARVREDALLNRVKSMVEERQWSMNEYNLRIMRDIEDLKSQIQQMRLERKEANKRINHLESENKYMRQTLASFINVRNAERNYENDMQRPRKPFPSARRNSQQLNLHFANIQQQAAFSLEEQDETACLHMLDNTPSTTSTADIAVIGDAPVAAEPMTTQVNHSFSSSDGAERIGINNGNLTATTESAVVSPPTFALVSGPIEAPKRRKDVEKLKRSEQQQQQQRQSDAEQLRQDLNEAMEARKEADDRIIALENLVKTLTVNNAQPVDANCCIAANGDGPFNTNSDLYVNGGGNATNPTTTLDGIKNQHQAKVNKLQQQYAIIANNSNYFAPIPSQQQQQTQIKLTSPLSPPKLSVAGPITDL